MSTFEFTIPTHTTTFPIPGGGFYQSDSLGLTPILDPDNILIAGGSVVQPGINNPPTPLGYISNPTANNKTINYTINLNISTQVDFQGMGVQLYIGISGIANSNLILDISNVGTFNNSYTFSGSINVPPNLYAFFWANTFLADYTINATVTGELVGQQTTVGNGNGVEFFCDISPDCPPSVSFSENRIICDEIEFVECNAGDCPILTVNNGLLLCSELDSWNCNLCGNDLPYNSPVEVGDSLYFQFQQPDEFNGNSPTLDGNGVWGQGYGWAENQIVQGYIRDCCTGDYLRNPNNNALAFATDYSTNYFVGIFESTNFSGSSNNYTNIQQIKIDTPQLYADLLAQFGRTCFYFEWQFFMANLVPLYTIYSEPFEFVPCDNQTVLLEGSLTRKDCNNLFYGDPGCVIVNNPINVGGGIILNNYQPDCRYFVGTGVFPFRQYYRVYGSFEQTAFEIVKELVGTRLKSTSIDLTESWLLRTDRVPQRVAKLIATILSSEYVYINKKEYVVDGQIPKNNEIGSQWFIEANVKRVNCTNNYSCN